MRFLKEVPKNSKETDARAKVSINFYLSNQFFVG
jgi:hypothetical protein